LEFVLDPREKRVCKLEIITDDNEVSSYVEIDFENWIFSLDKEKSESLSQRLPQKKGIKKEQLKKTGFETEYEPLSSKPRSVSKDPKKEADPNVLSDDSISLSSSLDESDVVIVSKSKK
jgi:hypothetical protein